ncbi:MAG: serpin family protein [Clostridiaceae bacterium]
MVKKLPALFLSLVLLAGCAVSTEAAFLKEVPLNNTTTEITVPAEIKAALFEMTSEITSDYFKASKKANQIFSPLSLWYALGVLREGATGASLAELNQMMKVSSNFNSAVTLPELSKTLNFMEPSNLVKTETKNGIRLTNGIFFDQKYRSNIKEKFLDQAATVWGTETAQVDFTKKAETQKLIKDWVSRKTDEFIPDYEASFLDDGSAILNIYNVLYLKDQWIMPFALLPDQVFNAPTGAVDAPFIGITGFPRAYAQTSRYQAAAYNGEKGIRVWFILPNVGVDAMEIIPDLKDILSQEESAYLNFKAPVLDVDGDNLSLKSILMDLGYTQIFTNGEFNNMLTGVQAVVDDIKQKTKLQMDEKGFKAAAVTEITVTETSAPADEPIDFIVDRPYLLVIEYQGLPLFISHISDPTAK